MCTIPYKMVNLKNQNNSKNWIKTMRALIITSLLGDDSGIAEEVEKQLQYQDKKQESDEVVNIHQSTCFPGMWKWYHEQEDKYI